MTASLAANRAATCGAGSRFARQYAASASVRTRVVEPFREARERLPNALDVRQIHPDGHDVAQLSSSASSRRIASIAAMQPMPAAVIACR